MLGKLRKACVLVDRSNITSSCLFTNIYLTIFFFHFFSLPVLLLSHFLLHPPLSRSPTSFSFTCLFLLHLPLFPSPFSLSLLFHIPLSPISFTYLSHLLLFPASFAHLIYPPLLPFLPFFNPLLSHFFHRPLHFSTELAKSAAAAEELERKRKEAEEEALRLEEKRKEVEEEKVRMELLLQSEAQEKEELVSCSITLHFMSYFPFYVTLLCCPNTLGQTIATCLSTLCYFVD